MSAVVAAMRATEVDASTMSGAVGRIPPCRVRRWATEAGALVVIERLAWIHRSPRRAADQTARSAEGPNPLRLSAIVDESVIRRVVGGPRVMGDQLLRQLIDTAQLPDVTCRSCRSTPAIILPRRLSSAFGVLGDHSFDVFTLEGLAGDNYEERPSEVARYRAEFERLGARLRMSVKMIENLLDI
jgi:hypothetical protein